MSNTGLSSLESKDSETDDSERSFFDAVLRDLRRPPIEREHASSTKTVEVEIPKQENRTIELLNSEIGSMSIGDVNSCPASLSLEDNNLVETDRTSSSFDSMIRKFRIPSPEKLRSNSANERENAISELGSSVTESVSLEMESSFGTQQSYCTRPTSPCYDELEIHNVEQEPSYFASLICRLQVRPIKEDHASELEPSVDCDDTSFLDHQNLLKKILETTTKSIEKTEKQMFDIQLPTTTVSLENVLAEIHESRRCGTPESVSSDGQSEHRMKVDEQKMKNEQELMEMAEKREKKLKEREKELEKRRNLMSGSIKKEGSEKSGSVEVPKDN